VTNPSFAAAGDEHEKAAALRLKAAPGGWIGAALRGLPAGGELRLVAQATGPVTLHLLDAEDYRGFPHTRRSLLTRAVDGECVAEVTLPVGGDYYVVVDNRDGTSEPEVVLAFRARAPRLAAGPELGDQLRAVANRIRHAFAIEGLELRIAPLGAARVAADGRAITLSREFVDRLGEALADRQMLRDALLFVIMHEIAGRWPEGEPERPEDLAAALMILFNQLDALRQQAEAVAALPAGAAPDHPALRPQTASRVLARLEDPGALLSEQQDALLPMMTTATLRELQAVAPNWADPARVADALEATPG
jgi:hypothetical protein